MKIDFNGISEKRADRFCDGKGTTWLKMFDKSDVKFISGRLEPNSAIGKIGRASCRERVSDLV